MTDYSDLFSQEKFQETLTQYCEEAGWEVSEFYDCGAYLTFVLDESSPYELEAVYILNRISSLQFSIKSYETFLDDDEIPSEMTLHLMRENSTLNVGYWSINAIESELMYSLIHKEDVRTLDVDRFIFIISEMLAARLEFIQFADGEFK